MRSVVVLSSLIGLVLSGCTVTGPTKGTAQGVRSASGLPDHFLVGALQGDATSEPAAGTDCKSPMIDPKSHARLILVRSANGEGDYKVPAGRYGVGEKELLRIACGTGRAVGIVKAP